MLRSLTKFAPAAAAGAGFVAGSATLFTVEAKSVDVEAVKRDVRFSTLSNHRRI